MDHFHYRDDQLYCEDVQLSAIADQVGTPCYVYSYATLRRHYQVVDQALANIPHLICFAVKANPNSAVLSSLAALGSGADIVSGGELFRALRSGIDPQKIVFSGVGKQVQEISAALNAQILLFNVESEAELKLLDETAGRIGCKAPVALRVNPQVTVETHPYVATGLASSKFGIPIDRARDVYRDALRRPNLLVRGIDCHIGSQLVELAPLSEALNGVVSLALALIADGAQLRYFDVGGGLGIPYGDEQLPGPDDYGRIVAAAVERFAKPKPTVICEPGRVIIGNAGVMLTRVLLHKETSAKRFCVVDAAMNDLLRPALYGSHHAIWPALRDAQRPSMVFDVVGPVCESGDFLAKDRPLPVPNPGDLLAVRSAGAYGHSMASNYNSRPRCAEVLVRADRWAVVRAREKIEDLVATESIPSWTDP